MDRPAVATNFASPAFASLNAGHEIADQEDRADDAEDEHHPLEHQVALERLHAAILEGACRPHAVGEVDQRVAVCLRRRHPGQAPQ